MSILLSEIFSSKNIILSVIMLLVSISSSNETFQLGAIDEFPAQFWIDALTALTQSVLIGLALLIAMTPFLGCTELWDQILENRKILC